MNKLINIPNFITLIRAILIWPMFNYFLTNDYFTAILIYAIFVLLDVLDGFSARKLHSETNFGKTFDVVVDLIAGLIVLFFLLKKGLMPLLFLLLVAVPLLLIGWNLVRSYTPQKRTFVHAKWRHPTAVMINTAIIILVINNHLLTKFAYLLLIYFYLAAFKYTLEINKLKHNKVS